MEDKKLVQKEAARKELAFWKEVKLLMPEHSETANKRINDLIESWYKGKTMILEVKNGKKPPSARKLTDAEQRFHDDWPGDNLHVVLSADDAVKKFDW